MMPKALLRQGLAMQIGYARSSTIDQEAGYEAQIKTLNAAGYDKVFSEKVSSVGQRDQLEPALDYAREGDALVVTKLDRLARSVFHLVAIGERLERCRSKIRAGRRWPLSLSTGERYAGPSHEGESTPSWLAGKRLPPTVLPVAEFQASLEIS
jgi:hypothetical protein